jgi:dihydrolipoamide dehydrogenase
MISEAGLAMVLDATAWEVAMSIHPHPTLSEAIGEAALAVDGRAIHY